MRYFELDTGGRIYNTLFSSNLWVGEINLSVCYWQAFPGLGKIALQLTGPICELQENEVLWIWPRGLYTEPMGPIVRMRSKGNKLKQISY